MLDCTISKPEGTLPTVEIKEIEPVEVEEQKQELEVAEEVEEDVAEKIEESATDSIEPEPKPVVVMEEIEENIVTEKPKPLVNTKPNIIREQVAKKIGRILQLRIPKPGIKTESAEPAEERAIIMSEGDFRVESPGTLYNQWSNTVLINKDTLESWGKKIKEVELQTEKRRVTICKAYPVPDITPRAIQVPDKIKASLRIEDGAYVKVTPIQK
jgi:hypothetical protein